MPFQSEFCTFQWLQCVYYFPIFSYRKRNKTMVSKSIGISWKLNPSHFEHRHTQTQPTQFGIDETKEQTIDFLDRST